MKLIDIDRFFKALDERVGIPLKVLITGGAASIIWGGTRATQDIDFELEFKLVPKNQSKNLWLSVQKSIEEVVRLSGIVAQYSDDIDRWSSIRLPSKKSSLYKKIGKIEIRVLDVQLWAIGKLTRYLESDVSDLIEVLPRTSADSLARLCGKALGISPPSPVQSKFREHVDQFFDTYAKKIWGLKSNPERLKKQFLLASRRSNQK